MARWQTKANAESEISSGGEGKFEPAPRGFYTIQVADTKDGMTTPGKNPSRPMVVLECEIADGPYLGKKVWHTVVQIPADAKGHGIMVHSLHAFGMAHDGDLDFDTDEFQGKTAKALLGVKPFTKIVNGTKYTNMVNYIEELYTENNPQPEQLPPDPLLKERGNPALSHAAGEPAVVAGKSKEEEECPF